MACRGPSGGLCIISRRDLWQQRGHRVDRRAGCLYLRPQISLVKTGRKDGKVQQEHVASLGSVPLDMSAAGLDQVVRVQGVRRAGSVSGPALSRICQPSLKCGRGARNAPPSPCEGPRTRRKREMHPR